MTDPKKRSILSDALNALHDEIDELVPLAQHKELRNKLYEWAKKYVEVFSAERIETVPELMNNESYISDCKKEMAHRFAETLWNVCSESKDWLVPIHRAPNFRPVHKDEEPYLGKAKKMSVQIFAFKRL